jgi:two-component SAPR family response regulator
LLATFDNAMEPLEFLKNNKVDLLFLDIEMDYFTGIQMLESLNEKSKVILTTANPVRYQNLVQ